MDSIRTIIAALRQEILTALSEGKDLAGPARLEADRVTVSLNVFIQEHRRPDGTPVPSFGVVSCAAGEDQAALSGKMHHAVTIEFKVVGESSTERASAKPAQHEITPAKITEADERVTQPVVETLGSIIGAPGFDSAARATVFREVLEELSDEQARVLSVILNDGQSADAYPDLKRAKHLLSRLTEKGPAGSARGRELLAQLLNQHPVHVLVGIARKKWKTQEEWLGEAPLR